MTSLERPSLANRMILARMTLQYGDVYFRATDLRACRSSCSRLTSNGLFRGIRGEFPLTPEYQITSPNRPRNTSSYLRMGVLSHQFHDSDHLADPTERGLQVLR